MKRKIVGLFVCMLLISTVLPVAGDEITVKNTFNNGLNKIKNTNCLVIGYTNYTFIRPFPTLLFDFPRLSPWLFNNTLLRSLLAYPYVIRVKIPTRFGAHADIGGRSRFTEYGNITYDYYKPAFGWICTIGSNGVQTCNGKFYGNISCDYTKSVRPDDDEIYGELWDAVGIKGFIGLYFYSLLGSEIKTFYLGFARKIDITENYPYP